MKTLMISLTTLMTLGLFAGTASARPGDHRGGWNQPSQGHDGWDNDGDGWVDEYDENTSYAVPDFDGRVRSGRMEFREVRRIMRFRMQQRIAQKTRLIHARFGYSRIAYRKIAQMKDREHARFQSRLAFMRVRFDQLRREARRDRWDRHDGRNERVGYRHGRRGY